LLLTDSARSMWRSSPPYI